MLFAPLSFGGFERLLERWRARRAPPEFDTIDGAANPVIIAGFGRYGQIVARVLRMAGIASTALEASYQQVDFVRRFGNKVYYGDASRLELLTAARADEAKLFVLAIDDVEASMKTADVVRKHFPPCRSWHAPATACTTIACATLISMSMPSSARPSCPASKRHRRALLQCGFDEAHADRAVALFRAHDERTMEAQYAVRQDEQQLIQTTTQAAAQLQELFEADAEQEKQALAIGASERP